MPFIRTKKSFLENLDLNELKTKYVDEEYSILDLGIYINKKYDSILFSKIPDSFIRTLIKKYFPDDYRDVKSSTNTKKIKQKYENTMLEHFGCKHNFQKECSSRKEWEKRLFEEEIQDKWFKTMNYCILFSQDSIYIHSDCHQVIS